MRLTGKSSIRKSILGKIIVTVEEGGYAMWPYSRDVTWGTRFRDAKATDMLKLELIKYNPALAASPASEVSDV